MQTLVYEHTTKGVVHRIFFSGTVSENLDIYGIMQGVSIFSLSRFLFMLMQITVRHLNIRRTCQKVQRERSMPHSRSSFS